MLIYDSLRAGTRELRFSGDPAAQPVTELIDYELFCAGPDPEPPAVAAEELAAILSAEAPPVLLDVRTVAEREQLRIRGSLAVPIDELEAGAAAVLGPVIVYCERDPRSIRAAKLLIARGNTDVQFLRGGVRGLADLAPELLEGSAR
ncbi:rhodanese-like domain-containing protein [Leucobacter insecticola]|uniref:rhodanese-like domain-containing protein n=1 Tax=Leucobacter insecticola TaxID=2714934 RepID=UPI003137AD3F